MLLKKMVHIKCRSNYYPFGGIKRLVFSDNLVPWSVAFNDYNPPEYNSPSLLNKPWADPDIGNLYCFKLFTDIHITIVITGDPNFNPQWNELDNNVNRHSYAGTYILSEGRPLNPKGRTGLKGRGVLGRWGPNHAADPVVTRWKRCDDGRNQMDPSTNL